MGRPITTDGVLTELATAMGGLSALAKELGVSLRTVQYWNSCERSPTGPARRMLATMAAVRGLKPPFDVTSNH